MINATYKFTGSPLPVNLLGYSFSRVTEIGDRLGGTGQMVLSFRKLSYNSDQHKKSLYYHCFMKQMGDEN